jgi:hypothetical protein
MTAKKTETPIYTESVSTKKRKRSRKGSHNNAIPNSARKQASEVALSLWITGRHAV